MGKNYDNFVKWFKEPLNGIYGNPHAGFAILMISLPILERYLRQKSRVFEKKNLDENFREALLKMFPSLKDTDTARKFWEVYRHGLLHQAALKAGDMLLAVAVHGEAQEIEFDGHAFTVSPVKFSQKVVNTIEKDFPTYEGVDSPKHGLPQVSDSTGRSGWNPDIK
jgi:hypothetical protein